MYFSEYGLVSSRDFFVRLTFSRRNSVKLQLHKSSKNFGFHLKGRKSVSGPLICSRNLMLCALAALEPKGKET